MNDEVRIPIEDSFDLHSFLPHDIAGVLAEYLEAARGERMAEVRVIHGKGTGTRRAHVRKLLASSPFVADFFDAPPERGGLGATIVRLRP